MPSSAQTTQKSASPTAMTLDVTWSTTAVTLVTMDNDKVDTSRKEDIEESDGIVVVENEQSGEGASSEEQSRAGSTDESIDDSSEGATNNSSDAEKKKFGPGIYAKISFHNLNILFWISTTVIFGLTVAIVTVSLVILLLNVQKKRERRRVIRVAGELRRDWVYHSTRPRHPTARNSPPAQPRRVLTKKVLHYACVPVPGLELTPRPLTGEAATLTDPVRPRPSFATFGQEAASENPVQIVRPYSPHRQIRETSV